MCENAESWRAVANGGCEEVVSCRLWVGPDDKGGVKGATTVVWDSECACANVWWSCAAGGTLVLVGLANKSARMRDGQPQDDDLPNVRAPVVDGRKRGSLSERWGVCKLGLGQHRGRSGTRDRSVCWRRRRRRHRVARAVQH